MFLSLAFPLLCSTGCVGTMCGDACGPILFGCGNGCGDCEGCGELYVDPWINEPADACDPCDKCGNHNGQSCGKCRSVFSGVESLWGYRCGVDTSCGGGNCGGGGCDSGCGPDCGGCESCGEGDGEFYGDHYSNDPVYSSDGIAEFPQPAYKPERTRKIFQPKSRTANRTQPTPARF